MPNTRSGTYSNLPLKDAAKRCNVSFSQLKKWCDEGKVPFHENLDGGSRFVSVSVLPMIRALAEGKEVCRLCRNTGRATIAGVLKDCPKCGSGASNRKAEVSVEAETDSAHGNPGPHFVPVYEVLTDGNGHYLGIKICNCGFPGPYDPHNLYPTHAESCPLGEAS